MEQTRFSLKKNGKIRSLDSLYDEAVDEITDALYDLDTDDALDLGNEYRENNRYNLLYENTESELNDQLDGVDPYELLKMGEDWNSSADFFSYDYDLSTTDDVWEDIEVDELARSLLDGDSYDNIPSDIQDILDDFEEAKEALENMNKYRAEAEEVLNKYLNCEAEVSDLLQCLDKLIRTDEAWSQED